jgi:hypothetical protein
VCCISWGPRTAKRNLINRLTDTCVLLQLISFRGLYGQFDRARKQYQVELSPCGGAKAI